MGQVALIWCDLVVPMNRPRTHANLDAIPYSKRGDSLTTNNPVMWLTDCPVRE